jgi:TRAP-type mannitol/chloroaromatic compound transport system permease large subunit
MKGIVPPGITTADIYRSITPFLLLQLIGLIILMVAPEIILFLPNMIFGG